MLQTTVVSKALLRSLFSGDGAYQLAFSMLFGMNVWNTFLAGPIAWKTLPRQQFGALQARQFPLFFGISSALSSALLAKWIFDHPTVISNFAQITKVDVLQAWTLGSMFAMHTINMLVLGPTTSKVMFQRHKLERSEKKSYSNADVSDEMKRVNKRFGMLHGLSSLTNLVSIIAALFHALWLGNYGSKGY